MNKYVMAVATDCRRIGRIKRYGLRSILTLALCVSLSLGSLTGCGDGTRVVFTTGLSKDEVFRIGDETCTVAEVMVYLTNIQNQYENVYGSEVWQVSLDGVTLEENIKEIVLAKVAQMKTMYLLAKERQIVLDEEEQSKVEAAAEEYFTSLNVREIELMEVEQDVIEKLYREYALAEKVYRDIIEDVNPEISDDEARTITVQQIFKAIYTTDKDGNQVSYSDKKIQTQYADALAIRARVLSGEEDFPELAAKYSDSEVILHSFGKGSEDPEYEEAAFSLATGEISQVISTPEGYYIIKCINTFDREQTDLNKLEILEKRRREVFDREYETFVDTLVRQINTDCWEEVELLHQEEVTTADFFEVYARYFPAEEAEK